MLPFTPIKSIKNEGKIHYERLSAEIRTMWREVLMLYITKLKVKRQTGHHRLRWCPYHYFCFVDATQRSEKHRIKRAYFYSPSSPPPTEKSRSRTTHFWMRWALEVAFSLIWLSPSWMAAWTLRSRPPAISETCVALLPSFLQSSTASGVSSSSGSPVSGFTWHCREKNEEDLFVYFCWTTLEICLQYKFWTVACKRGPPKCPLGGNVCLRN